VKTGLQLGEPYLRAIEKRLKEVRPVMPDAREPGRPARQSAYRNAEVYRVAAWARRTSRTREPNWKAVTGTIDAAWPEDPLCGPTSELPPDRRAASIDLKWRSEHGACTWGYRASEDCPANSRKECKESRAGCPKGHEDCLDMPEGW